MQTNIKERMWAGVKAISPILLGVIPFAMIVGVFAVDAGLTQLEGIGMTAIVYAGASQLAAIQMLVERSA
ncbi:MAG: branched-chain amino acid ABC transporter permease, partial [Chloroflexi bacterium]|nr:branched-chain amino acid ABC transporter permease [Chloroflexota bacterium]